MSNIVYILGENLYINLTNKCSCSCLFCIRNGHKGVGDAQSLWLSSEPSFEEVKSELLKYDLSKFKNIVFCGFGEPTEAYDVLISVCCYLKENTKTKIRLNTNGLSDLVNGRPTALDFQGLIDIVSISLNAPNKEKYNEISRPKFGINSFLAILKFADCCKNYIPEVIFTVVDTLPSKEIEECKILAKSMGIPLRIRNVE